jgi:hypothetical protein
LFSQEVGMGTALIQLATAADKRCAAWSTLSGSAVTQIVVTSSGGATEHDARALYDGLLTAVRRSGAQAEQAKCGGDLPWGPEGCWAVSHPGAIRRVLIWVADAALTPPVASPTPSPGRPYDIVLPLHPIGTDPRGLPTGIATSLARPYQPGQIGAVVPDALIISGLSVDAFRIFISYRHADCAAVAEQLFDELGKSQFDVYLDRFRTLPGTNFLERIRFELADKACVLLLDSKDVGASDWVRGEYAFARKYRLGLIAVDLPGGKRTFRRIATRVNLNTSAGATFTAQTRLVDRDIAAAAVAIRHHYDAEVARRFRYQRRLILSAAILTGAAHSLRTDGNFDIAGGGRTYVAAATARPPALASLRPVSEAAGSAAKGVLVGPRFSLTHSAGLDVDWLASKSNSVVVDERRIRKAMARMANGRL